MSRNQRVVEAAQATYRKVSGLTAQAIGERQRPAGHEANGNPNRDGNIRHLAVTFPLEGILLDEGIDPDKITRILRRFKEVLDKIRKNTGRT